MFNQCFACYGNMLLWTAKLQSLTLTSVLKHIVILRNQDHPLKIIQSFLKVKLLSCYQKYRSKVCIAIGQSGISLHIKSKRSKLKSRLEKNLKQTIGQSIDWGIWVIVYIYCTRMFDLLFACYGNMQLWTAKPQSLTLTSLF